MNRPTDTPEEIKTSSEFNLERSEPRQITIWESFGEEVPPPPENITFSVNCIDDWPLVQPRSNSKQDLNPIVTEAKDLSITAPPGYYRSGKKAFGSFVGEQEWRLFIVLRRMALVHGGYQLDGNFALSFTLRELAAFYKDSTGKTVSHSVFKRRLEVLRTSVYQVADRNQTAHFSLLRELFIATKEELKKDGSAKCYVMFDHLTEKTITSGNGILIDYDLMCTLPHMAAWIYNKLETAGLTAGITVGRPYKLWLKDTLYRVGLGNSSKTTNALKKELSENLTHLIKAGVLKEFSFEDKLQKSGRGRPKLLDSEVSLLVTEEFCTRMKTKLFATKPIRTGKKDSIQLASLKAMDMVHLPQLELVKRKDGFVGHYKRSKENDPRKGESPVPAGADWREGDRRTEEPEDGET